MLCDLYAFEAALHPRPSSEMQSNGGGDIPFFSDPCYFPDYEETFPSPASIYPSFCFFSPPRISLQDLSLYYSKSMQPLPNVPNLIEFENSSVLKVKSQECEMGNQYLVPQRYSGTDSETESKLMKQLPYETPCFQNQRPSSLDDTLFNPQMRRVCGTGDVQNIHETYTSHTEKTSCKDGRYSAKERKEKMPRYRAKRSKRNFNKTIKMSDKGHNKGRRSTAPKKGKGKFVQQSELIHILLPAVQSSSLHLSPHAGTPPGSASASSSFLSPHIQTLPDSSTFIGLKIPSTHILSTDAASLSSHPIRYEPGTRLSDGRLVIRPHGVDEFYPHMPLVTILSQIIHSKFEHGWPTFTKVPNIVKNLWFAEFKRLCAWDPSTERQIYKIWRKKCSAIMRASFRDIRTGKTKGDWLSLTARAELNEYWQSDEFKTKSTRNKANRAADTGGCLHRGGRVTFSEHKRRMEIELGRKVQIPEVFKRIQHNEKKGGWIGKKASDTYNLVPQSYNGTDSENVPKLMMQPPAYETPCFQSQALSSPYHTLFNPQMRRVCRNGDSKNIQETHTSQTEKASFKVGRYSAEERKERIAKYRAKKSKRNFNKTIEYECRKTLADKRRRVRGKFSRDDETSDIPNPKP